jgi:hypothetical protein
VVPENTDEDAGTEGDDATETDFSNLIRHFEDAADLDDQVASDVDTGIDVGDAPELPEDVDQPALEIGDTIDVASDQKSLIGEADEFGPNDEVGGSDAIEPLPDAVQGEDSDGVTGDDVETAELAELDAVGEDDDLPRTAPHEEIGLVLEDDPPGPAVLPWLDVEVPPGPSRTVVATYRGTVLAAGSSIAAIDESGVETTLVPEAGAMVTSILATPDGSIFFTTLRGQLFRVDSRGSECIDAWLQAVDHEKVAYALELGGMTPSSRPAMLLRTGNGRRELLESTDHGSTFRRVDLGGQILSVSSGSPPVCLLRGERAARVLRSEATGGFGLTGATLRTDGKNPSVAAHGDVVAVLDPDRSVHVSADGGRSFRSVVGSARATAIEAGLVAGRPVVFAALFNPATETTNIAYVDAASAEAVLVATVDAGDHDDGDRARVVSLAWNEHTETLWGAGAFGLRCWRRPPSA